MRRMLLSIALALAATPAMAQTTEINICWHVCTMPKGCTTNVNLYSVAVINMNGWVSLSCPTANGIRHQWTRHLPDWLPEDLIDAAPPKGNTELSCQTFCVQSGALRKRRHAPN